MVVCEQRMMLDRWIALTRQPGTRTGQIIDGLGGKIALPMASHECAYINRNCTLLCPMELDYESVIRPPLCRPIRTEREADAMYTLWKTEPGGTLPLSTR